jgi:hypothetical protein
MTHFVLESVPQWAHTTLRDNLVIIDMYLFTIVRQASLKSWRYKNMSDFSVKPSVSL